MIYLPPAMVDLREIRKKTKTSHARRKSIDNIQFLKMFKRDYLRQYRKQTHEYVYYNGYI